MVWRAIVDGQRTATAGSLGKEEEDEVGDAGIAFCALRGRLQDLDYTVQGRSCRHGCAQAPGVIEDLL